MPALERLTNRSHRGLTQAEIIGVFETKVFYLIRGRNAWHSTWVTHYFDRCMHSDLWSAKLRAEEQRQPGSTFTIREQPALCFATNKGQILVTEINNSTPLSRWTSRYRAAPNGCFLNPKFCGLERLISPGTTGQLILRGLEDRSHFPSGIPIRSDHFFVLASRDAAGTDQNNRPRLKQRHSSSGGADYYLSWTEAPCATSGKAVRRVAKALALRLERQPIPSAS